MQCQKDFLERIGAQAMRSRLGRLVLATLRPSFLSISLSRQHSFRAAPSWRTELYTDSPPDLTGTLLDLCVLVPGVLESADILQEAIQSGSRSQPTILRELQRLMSHMVNIHEHLSHWLIDFFHHNNSSASASPVIEEVYTHPSFSHGITPPTTPSSQFASLVHAEALVICWRALLSLQLTALNFQSYTATLPASRTTRIPVPYLDTTLTLTHALARKIRRAMPYVFGCAITRGILTCGLGPMVTVMQYFAGMPEEYGQELRWYEELGRAVERHYVTAAVAFERVCAMGVRSVPWWERRRVMGRR